MKRSLFIFSLTISAISCGYEEPTSDDEQSSAITEEDSTSWEPTTCEEAPDLCVPPTDEEVGDPPLDSSMIDQIEVEPGYQGAPDYSDYECTYEEETQTEQCVVLPGPSWARRIFCAAAHVAGARVCNRYIDANLIAQNICDWYCPWKFPGDDLGSKFKRGACRPICIAKVTNHIAQYEPIAKAACNNFNDWLYERCMNQ